MHRSIKPVAMRISGKKKRKSMAVQDFIPGGEIVVYKAPDGEVQLDVHLEGETVWLTQQQMADLFGRERTVITKHLRNIFRQGELELKSVCAKFAHTAGDGKIYQVDYFNLDAVLSVGYRVNSKRQSQTCARSLEFVTTVRRCLGASTQVTASPVEVANCDLKSQTAASRRCPQKPR